MSLKNYKNLVFNYENLEINIYEIINIAKKAGEPILEIYNTNFEHKLKEDKSPLTKADTESNKIITQNLNKLFPNIPLLSEEEKEISFDKRKNWEFFWLIDLLDGTKEFINKNGEFTVNIALIHKNKPVLGVVYLPVYDVFYLGDLQNGSFKKQKENIAKLPISNQRDYLNVVASKSHFNEETQNFIDKLKEKSDKPINFISAGSSLKLCYVAEGKADIYPRLGPTMEWDTAAAHAVVKFAGKNVYDYNKKELRYNKESLKNNFFIVE